MSDNKVNITNISISESSSNSIDNKLINSDFESIKDLISEPSKKTIPFSDSTCITSISDISLPVYSNLDKNSVEIKTKNSSHNFENKSKKSDEIKSNSSNNSSNNSSKQLDTNFILNNKIIIDVAVLCQEYTGIDVTCKDNIINLDEIEVTKEIFQSIFYPYCDNFGINKDFINNNKQILPYISIHPDFRSFNKKRFFLLEELIANIERDLNISRNCFTKESIIELTAEISSIKTLCDINCCSVLSSLSWLNILEIIDNYKLIKTCLCNYECQCPKYKAIPVCVVNLIFKTPTAGVKSTIVRLHYKITNLL